MRDLPSGLDLMALARRLLLEEILPLVPEERRPDIHLAATSMAIAAREAANGDAPLREVRDLIAEFYGETAPHPLPLPAGGEREGPAQREGEGDADLAESASFASPAICEREHSKHRGRGSGRRARYCGG